MNDIYICKIPLENLPGEFVPVYSTWTDHSFSLSVFHKDRAWDKAVSEEDLKSLCGFTHNSVKEYLKETKKAFTCDGGCAEFTYSFVKCEFIWKKVIDIAQNIKMKFGSLLLEEIPVSSFAEKSVDFLLNYCITLKTRNSCLRKENDDLREANVSLSTHVVSITKLKTEMEETLYAKALALLNAKKKKICELQEIIETRPTTAEVTLDSGHKLEGVEEDSALNKMSDPYGSETELDTDDNSDQEYAKASSTHTNTGVEEDELLPTAAKVQKLDIATNIISEGLTKGSTENKNDDDDDDIFVPTRQKKNIKSGVSH